MEHGKIAEELFLSGYNCAQSVTVAFCDLTGFDRDYAARLSSPFGGGMGRMREVCGAVSGMFIVLGHLYGYDTVGDDTDKKRLYEQVQQLAEKFRSQAGSIICRDILKDAASDPTPSARTAEYYASRPCAKMVRLGARLMDEFIAAHPLDK